MAFIYDSEIGRLRGALRHFMNIACAASVLGVAVLAILCPDVVVRWAKRAHPDLSEDDRTTLWIARLVGVGGLGVGLFLLVIMIRSLSN